jgi:tetratricopeptide (TPR) repeat protein
MFKNEKMNFKLQDAKTNVMTMEDSIDVVEGLMDDFYNNKFEEMEDRIRSYPDFDDNLYLKLALCYKKGILAIFSLEKEVVDEALESINNVYHQLSKERKGATLSSWILGPYVNDYTDEQVHAEVVYAEVSLAYCLLTFASDPTFFSVIRVALRIKRIHSIYKLVGEILKEKTNWKSEKMRVACDDAHKLGWGFYNILLSHMPERILRILAFVGFDCNRDLGFRMTRCVTQAKRTYRHKLVSFGICWYSFIIEQYFGGGTTDKGWVELLTRERLQDNPHGVFELYFRGRMKQLQGNHIESIAMFQKCINVQNKIKTIHTMCTWDLLWSHAILCDWKKASQCALYLHESCSWSKATNLYQYACFQYMIMEEEKKDQMLPQIQETMKRVPAFRRRIGGRTIPPEKFAITKALAFTDGTCQTMTLPALELFYVWNVFGNTGQNRQLLQPLIERVDKKLAIINKDSEDYFMLLLLKGVCMRNLAQFQESVNCFTQILNNERNIKSSTYIVPHAALELGICYADRGNITEAKAWLRRAQDDYSGYLMESLLHLRIHALNQRL